MDIFFPNHKGKYFFTDESLPATTGNSIVVQVCDKRGDSAATSLNQLLFQAMGAETVTVTATVNGQETSIEVKIALFFFILRITEINNLVSSFI